MSLKFVRRIIGGKEQKVNLRLEDLNKPSVPQLTEALGSPDKVDYLGNAQWVNSVPEEIRSVYWKIREEALRVNSEIKRSEPDLKQEERHKKLRSQISPIIESLYASCAQKGIKETLGERFTELSSRIADQSDRLSRSDKGMTSGDENRNAAWAELSEDISSEIGSHQQEVPKTASFNPLKSEIRSQETSASRITTLNDVQSASAEDLFHELEEGLEYDRFDTQRFRAQILSKSPTPTFNEVMTLVMCYIFCGNNQTRLNDKVRDKGMGTLALQVCNRYGVVRTKMNSDSITLARIGIAFSPMVYALRVKLQADGKLPASGVICNTPQVLQDVALSGISDKVNRGSEIPDFLKKFNRTLLSATDKKKKDSLHLTEAEMDEIAQKFHQVALLGSSTDSLLQSWNYNYTGVEGAVHFYESAMNGLQTSSY